MANYTLDTAARFGEIPFTEFTKELVTGTFDSLLEAHIDQMEAYVEFMSAISQDLTTYINTTVDNVSFSDVSAFLQNYQLPQVSDAELTAIMTTLQNPPTSGSSQAPAIVNGAGVTDSDKWWQGLIQAVGPALNSLVGKINEDDVLKTNLESTSNFYNAVTTAVPKYKEIQNSIASLIASNKYALLQNISKQGMLRLVVTEGEIETKITFSTWNNSSSGSESGSSDKDIEKTKKVQNMGIMGLFKKKNKEKSKSITINTAKSYQRDSSGSRVDIFGRVLIRFKTDYAPLNN